MENWLQCTVTAGQFDNEFGVAGHEFNGAVFSLFTPKETVRFSHPPTKDQTTTGWVKVQVVQQRDNWVVVRLPRQTFQSGYCVTVRVDELEKDVKPSRKKPRGKS